MSFLPHELNTPLHGILAGVEFLRDEYAELQPSDVEELLWIIHQSALRMRRLVTNSLLHADLAAMQNGSGQKDAAKAAPLYVAATIRQTVEQEAKAVVRQEDTQAEIAEGTVHIQPYYLAKIVEEIVNNAYGFSKAGTPVEIVARPVEGAYVMTVKDRGRGMSQEEIAEISAFRQFQRQQYEQQGLGLGLAISQQLLILNGGTMNIDSTPGQGTQVQIILPLAG
jgi:signal transduction histidine kinase